MKKDNALTKLLFLIALIFVFASCNELFKDDDEPQEKDEYLVSYELERSYLPALIIGIIDQFKGDYPEVEAIQDKFKYGVMVYSIEYNTTFNGEDVVASGLVSIPIGEGPFPVLSYQNGTNTEHSEAPSANPNKDLYMLLEFTASTGFITSIPDYLGFGSSSNMFHPYLHEESTKQTVLDMLRAVDEMINNHELQTSVSDELYLTGYSQGGWSTMQVQKAIEQEHSNEFNLVASACAAGPYDLTFVNDYILEQTTYPMPYFAGYLFNSLLNQGVVSVAPNKVFKEPYAAKITSLYDGSKSGDEINAELTTNVSDLFTADYISSYKTDETYSSIVSALEENSVEAWDATTPMLLMHGTEDDFIPMQVTSDISQEFIAAGADDVTVLPLPGYDHSGGIIPAGLAALQWFFEFQEEN